MHRGLNTKPHSCCANLTESLTKGHTWRCLNILRTGVTCSKEHRNKWGYYEGDSICDCGVSLENTSHMLECPLFAHSCSLNDLQFSETVCRTMEDSGLMTRWHTQINKKQTPIRCNHTHNTHWVHLKCTHIKQRQYKPDWSCTIHTPIQNVTTTPSTDNTTAHHKQTTNHPLTNNNQPKDKNIVILQININGIRNKIEELKKLVHSTQPEIITIQESSLTQKAKTSKYPTTPLYAQTKSTNINIPKAINTHNTELQLIKIHISMIKYITVANTYFPTIDTTSPHYNTVDTYIAYCKRHVINIPDSILTGDVNAHSTLWYSHTEDHRGQLICDIISNSEHIILNTDTPTIVPHTTLRQATSPDITTISTTLYNRTTWHTIHSLNSDHLSIITPINTRTKYKLQQNRHTFTNYRKANGAHKHRTEAAFADIQPPPDIHTANTIFTRSKKGTLLVYTIVIELTVDCWKALDPQIIFKSFKRDGRHRGRHHLDYQNNTPRRAGGTRRRTIQWWRRRRPSLQWLRHNVNRTTKTTVHGIRRGRYSLFCVHFYNTTCYILHVL